MSMPPPQQQPRRAPSGRPEPNWRIAVIVLAAILALALFTTGFGGGSSSTKKLTYNQVIADAQAGQVETAKVNNDTGKITGTLKVDGKEQKFSVSGPRPIPDEVEKTLREKVPSLEFTNETTSVWLSFLPTILLLGGFIGLMVWMNRRASGQMNGIMNVGRSRAKVYT